MQELGETPSGDEFVVVPLTRDDKSAVETVLEMIPRAGAAVLDVTERIDRVEVDVGAIEQVERCLFTVFGSGTEIMDGTDAAKQVSGIIGKGKTVSLVVSSLEPHVIRFVRGFCENFDGTVLLVLKRELRSGEGVDRVIRPLLKARTAVICLDDEDEEEDEEEDQNSYVYVSDEEEEGDTTISPSGSVYDVTTLVMRARKLAASVQTEFPGAAACRVDFAGRTAEFWIAIRLEWLGVDDEKALAWSLLPPRKSGKNLLIVRLRALDAARWLDEYFSREKEFASESEWLATAVTDDFCCFQSSIPEFSRAELGDWSRAIDASRSGREWSLRSLEPCGISRFVRDVCRGYLGGAQGGLSGLGPLKPEILDAGVDVTNLRLEERSFGVEEEEEEDESGIVFVDGGVRSPVRAEMPLEELFRTALGASAELWEAAMQNGGHDPLLALGALSDPSSISLLFSVVLGVVGADEEIASLCSRASALDARFKASPGEDEADVIRQFMVKPFSPPPTTTTTPSSSSSSSAAAAAAGPKSRSQKEILSDSLLCKLVKHLARCIREYNRRCLVCSTPLRFQCLKPGLCDSPLCIFRELQLGDGFDLSAFVRSQPWTLELYLVLLYAAALPRGRLNLRFPERVSALVAPSTETVDEEAPDSSTSKSSYRSEFSQGVVGGGNDLVLYVMSRVPPVPTLRAWSKQGERTLKTRVDSIHPLIYPLIRWLIGTTHAHLRPKETTRLSPSSKAIEFVFQTGPPRKEHVFQDKLRDWKMRAPGGGSSFGFHGSHLGFWHPILAQGLKSFSQASGYVQNGRSYGDGVYLSEKPALALRYAVAGAVWPNACVGRLLPKESPIQDIQSLCLRVEEIAPLHLADIENFGAPAHSLSCMAGCEYIANPSKIRKVPGHGIVVVADDDEVATRFLWLGTPQSLQSLQSLDPSTLRQ